MMICSSRTIRSRSVEEQATMLFVEEDSSALTNDENEANCSRKNGGESNAK